MTWTPDSPRQGPSGQTLSAGDLPGKTLSTGVWEPVATSITDLTTHAIHPSYHACHTPDNPAASASLPGARVLPCPASASKLGEAACPKAAHQPTFLGGGTPCPSWTYTQTPKVSHPSVYLASPQQGPPRQAWAGPHQCRPNLASMQLVAPATPAHRELPHCDATAANCLCPHYCHALALLPLHLLQPCPHATAYSAAPC